MSEYCDCCGQPGGACPRCARPHAPSVIGAGFGDLGCEGCLPQGDKTTEPVCACGRPLSRCDGSRSGCGSRN